MAELSGRMLLRNAGGELQPAQQEMQQAAVKGADGLAVGTHYST